MSTEFAAIGNLVVRVNRHSKTFALLYPSPSTGKWRKMALGAFPAMTLDEARARAASISVAVRDGQDPLQTRDLVSHDTFGELAAYYMTEHRRRHRPITSDRVERMLKVDVLPILENYKADRVARADVSKVVEAVAKRGSYSSADAVLSVVKAVFNWAVERGRLEANPSVGLRKRNGGKIRDRVLDDDEIRMLWLGAETTDFAIREALRLQLLLGMRIGEVLEARKEEVDLNARTWVLPAHRTKSGRMHALPLSPLAAEVLQGVMKRAARSAWLFPGYVSGMPVQAHTGPIMMGRLVRRLGMKPLGTHDLRRTCATRLVEMGVEEAVVGRILNHSARTITGRHYVHYDRYPEMASALQAWSEKLAALVKP